MPNKPYLIAPMSSGLQNDIEPWLLPEDAFANLENAYVWRGRLRKRFGTAYLGGSELTSRLRMNVGTTDANGDLTVTVPGTIFAVGQMFSVATDIFTVVAIGVPGPLLSTGSGTGTYNTTTGALIILGAAAATSVYFYPSTPVMGLKERETISVNVEGTVGFDLEFAYTRLAGAWELLGPIPAAAGYGQWSSSNSQFYWTTNYRSADPYTSALWVVNNKPQAAGPPITDGIKYIEVGSSAWVDLRPQLDSGSTRFLESSAIIIGYKDRLVVLNTLEDESGSDRRYVNRARWSQNGDPTAPATAWLDDTPGRGGYVDAPTSESIITCEFIKDQLIVYFERSTWQLVYIGDFSLPFVWQQLNSELGAESRFSIVGFDQGAVGVGNVGIHTCNGVNVKRIDQKIPDEVFKIHNGNDGNERVYGIRDYYRELVYWAFPSQNTNPVFPTNVLVWNYVNDSWAFFEDSFTCFGYFQNESDLTWANVGQRYPTWEEWNAPWGSAQSQSSFGNVVAGNQQGFTFIIDADRSSNEQSLYITDMVPGSSTLTVVNHNLQSDDYILIENAQGITGLNGIVVRVSSPIVSSNSFTIDTPFAGTYTGGGKITRISNINITSKQWNPGTPIGRQFRMPYIDFLLDQTVNGQLSVDYLIDSTLSFSIQDQVLTPVLLGSNVLYTKQEDNSTVQTNQVRIWHRYYLQTEGSMIQIKIFMSDDQMRDLDISQSDFQMNALILYVELSGRIIG